MKPLRLPPGFKFTPSDSDLILHYLKKKINGEALPIINLIKDRDLYGKETPFQIYESCSSSFDSIFFDNWLYFFTKIKKKFTSAKRIDRLVGNGSWRKSNTTKVYDENSENLLIGYKTLLNFSVKSLENNTNVKEKQPNSWILYEYTLKGNDATDNDSIWTVCKFRKGTPRKDNPPSLKREISASAVVEDDECYEPEKKRTCYRDSSSAFQKKKYGEGLVVQEQQQCVIDDWLCVPTEDECQTAPASASASYALSPTTTPDDLLSLYEYNSQQPHQICADSNAITSSCWNECETTLTSCASKGAPTPTGILMPAMDSNDIQPQPGYDTYNAHSHDDCNTASTSYPLSSLMTLDDLPSFYEFDSEQPHKIGADSNAIASSCWNECETTWTSCTSKGEPTPMGIFMPALDSNDDQPQPGHNTLVAAQPGDQCASSDIDEEIRKSVSTAPFDEYREYWKALELVLSGDNVILHKASYLGYIYVRR